MSEKTSPVTDAEVEEALKNWQPFWKRPVCPEEWDKLVSQRAYWAVSARDTYCSAVAGRMPFWFIQRTARNRYVQFRKYQRTARRAAIEKDRLFSNLLHAVRSCR